MRTYHWKEYGFIGTVPDFPAFRDMQKPDFRQCGAESVPTRL